ncbi:MAG: UV DNA damage repair endonuclease UvsE [Thermoproteota archaeon]
MRIGYPCINNTIGCRSSRTFRLKSYSEKRLIETVEKNLDCLARTLRFNVEHDLLFFRISSDLIPFASHPICHFDWQSHFSSQFQEIGDYIQKQGIRISMHPGHFTVLNSIHDTVVENSVRELVYHSEVLDLMELSASEKIQTHIGGVYNDKERSKRRFIERFETLDDRVKRRLVIENDDSRYTLKDCLQVNHHTGVPVLFDVLHHEVNSSGETIQQAFQLFRETWKQKDGLPMVDYSSQKKGERQGRHVETIDLEHFREFFSKSKPYDFDIMLEIKDKEQSALKAIEIASEDNRFSAAKN